MLDPSTRLDFRRGKQRLVLRGLTHVDEAKTYRAVKREMQDLHAQGYRIFYEKIDKPQPFVHQNEQERRVAEFLDIVFGMYKIEARRSGQAEQSEILKDYPQDAINADISFSECVRLICAKGVHLNKRFLQLMKSPLFYQMIARPRRTSPILEQYEAELEVAGLMFILHAHGVIYRHRNNVAINDFIEPFMAQSKRGHALVHYGKGHLPGMRQLLHTNGWSLESQPGA